MRRIIPLARCLAIVLSAGFATSALAQEDAAPKSGPEYEPLKVLEGTWDAEITLAVLDPCTGLLPADVLKSKGVFTSKMECDGRWLTTDLQGEVGGEKFCGKGFDGYDPTSKKYVAVWVGSLVTKPMSLEGTYDEAAKTLTLTSEGPGLGVRRVTKMHDNDRYAMEMFISPPGGNEVKLMTIECKRRKE